MVRNVGAHIGANFGEASDCSTTYLNVKRALNKWVNLNYHDVERRDTERNSRLTDEGVCLFLGTTER